MPIGANAPVSQDAPAGHTHLTRRSGGSSGFGLDGPAQPQPVHHTDGEVLDQHVGLGDQLEEDLLAAGLHEIEHDGLGAAMASGAAVVCG